MYTLPLSGPGIIRNSDGARLVEGAPGWGDYVSWATTNSPSQPAPPPNAPRVRFPAWLALFTELERAWIFASDDAQVREDLAVFSSSPFVEINSSSVGSFIDACIALGSPITVPRKTAIMAGQAPN